MRGVRTVRRPASVAGIGCRPRLPALRGGGEDLLVNQADGGIGTLWARLETSWRARIAGWRWRVAHAVAVAALLLTVGAGAALAWQVGARARHAAEQELTRQAVAATQSVPMLQRWLAGPQALRSSLVDLAPVLDARIVALNLRGELLADSRSVSEAEPAWGLLPEVRDAFNGGVGQSARRNAVTGQNEFFVAVPVRDGGATFGALHFTFSRHRLEADTAGLRAVVWLVVGSGGGLVALLCVAMAEYWARGLRRLTVVVERMTAGDLDARIWTLHKGELGELAWAFNRMADKLQSQMKKRARERDRLNTVMHVMTDGVVILNKAGDVKLINPAAARLLNTTMDRAMNRSFVQAVRDHRIAEVWKRCQASNEEEVVAVELGATQFVRVVVTPFLRRVGRGYLVMLQDLTQVRRLQTVRQDFISNVSHELRTPLASLRALTETLRDGALDDPPAANRFLDRMEVELDALTQMVEELLELSRIESGQVPLRLNPVLPQAAVCPAVERLRTQAERNHLDLDVQVARDLPLVLVDAGRIHQVVTNLVHNAIKFTPAGGRIEVRATSDAAWVTVTVKDSGIGIAPHDLTRIFERFYKTDRSRAVGGTGLGLAIAKHLVQAHGGAIWAESQGGKGSVFYFTLPRAEPEEGAVAHAP